MKVVIQRSKKASVTVDKEIVGSIQHGIVVLVGFTKGDDFTNIDYIVDKVINLRIFDDEHGVMNKSLLDVDGSILSVSQFTLYADTSKGRRPSYINSLESAKARLLYEEFNNKIRESNVHVETGIFQAEMEVNLINDGPVTIIIER